MLRVPQIYPLPRGWRIDAGAAPETGGESDYNVGPIVAQRRAHGVGLTVQDAQQRLRRSRGAVQPSGHTADCSR
jgi:hypothetical protein